MAASSKSKVTFEVPPELRRLMDEHPEVNWSEVFRQAIERHARTMEIAERIRDEMEDPRVQAVASLLKKRSGERWRRDLANLEDTEDA